MTDRYIDVFIILSYLSGFIVVKQILIDFCVVDAYFMCVDVWTGERMSSQEINDIERLFP